MTREGAAALVIAVLAAGAGTLGCAGGTPQASDPPAVPPGTEAAAADGPAAPVSFADLAGVQAALARRRGRPLVVNFWATWCGPCLEEMPQLGALAREYAAAGPDFVGVSVDAWVTGEGAETEEKVRGALRRAGVAYTNLIYRGDQDPLVDAFRLPGPIPYSILYDRDGREAGTWVGPLSVEALRRAIASLH